MNRDVWLVTCSVQHFEPNFDETKNILGVFSSEKIAKQACQHHFEKKRTHPNDELVWQQWDAFSFTAGYFSAELQYDGFQFALNSIKPRKLEG